MLTIRQLAEFKEASTDTTDTDVAMPVIRERATKPLRLVESGMSAIEYIVETARSGEVIYVDEENYYNQHLWRGYKGLSTRYSCS
jgi:hypothetical protein